MFLLRLCHEGICGTSTALYRGKEFRGLHSRVYLHLSVTEEKRNLPKNITRYFAETDYLKA